MKLIINADDFGLSKSISDGIIEGILDGCITSTTIMSNMDYAKYAINKALEHNISCIGLHVNLTVGRPILKNDNITNEEGLFYYNKNQINNPKLTYDDAYNEIIAQIKKVEEYSNGKIKVDHLDAHHHLWDNENIKKAIIDIARQLNIPTRNENKVKTKCPDLLCMDFTIKNVSLNSLKEIIKKYKDKNITVELCTHPGYIDEYTKTITSYLNRKQELEVLKEAKTKNLFKDIKLINYQEF